MGFWEWVLRYGLDGIASGVLGGAVTGLVLWATIRHERRHAAHVDLRRAVAELQGKTLQLGFQHPEEPDDWATWIRELFSGVLHVQALAEPSAPELAAHLDACTDWLIEEVMPDEYDDFDPVAAKRLVTALNARLHVWLGDPERYSDRPPPDWPRRGSSEPE